MIMIVQLDLSRSGGAGPGRVVLFLAIAINPWCGETHGSTVCLLTSCIHTYAVGRYVGCMYETGSQRIVEKEHV